jgi:hypothetical protein
MVDTLGLLIGCHVTKANVSNKQGFVEMLDLLIPPLSAEVMGGSRL